MSHDQPRTRPAFYSQIDVSQTPYSVPVSGAAGLAGEQIRILREILAAQDRQNELLEELIGQVGATQRQRANELGQWKQNNPHLAKRCRAAAEALGKIQMGFLENITHDVSENFDNLVDGEFMLNEFVDRYGPRMAHLNGLLQVLSQLSSASDPANTPNLP